jgi:hypothetical protein
MPRTHDAIEPVARAPSIGHDSRARVALLIRLVSDLHIRDRAAFGRALDDARRAVAPLEPDPFEVGGAIERVLKFARSAADFCARAEKIQTVVAPLVTWIGPQAVRLERLVQTRGADPGGAI